jgi:ribosome maturation factor RimP
MDPRFLQEQIRKIVGPTIARLGYDLVAIEWIGGRSGAVLRLSIDRPGGITAEDCALVSERISPELDEADPIEHAYQLEVSSPGIDRPVQRMSDFERFIGYRCRFKLSAGAPRRRCTGAIRSVEKEPVSIVNVEVDGKVLALSFEQIERAHLVLDLAEYQHLAEDSGHDE